MTRSELARKIVGNAREYLTDLVPGAEVAIVICRTPRIAATLTGVQETITLTVVFDRPDEDAEVAP